MIKSHGLTKNSLCLDTLTIVENALTYVNAIGFNPDLRDVVKYMPGGSQNTTVKQAMIYYYRTPMKHTYRKMA